MAITVKEKANGRKSGTGSKPFAEVKCLLFRDIGDEDGYADADLKQALINQTSNFYIDIQTGLLVVATDYVIDETLLEPLKDVQAGIWLGTVKYGSEDSNKKTNEFSFNFETTGGTQRIFQSIKTIDSRNATDSNPAPDMGGAIGCTTDKVEGVEITIPTWGFGGTYYFPPAAVTTAFKSNIYQLTGKINDAPFMGCQEGECLFLGAQGAKRGRGDWEISFKFAGQASVTLPAIGDIPGGMKKRGWDYLWIRYEKKIIGAGADQTLAMAPKYAYIEQVYTEGSFSSLGIGT
jgi:hypothetical protein